MEKDKTTTKKLQNKFISIIKWSPTKAIVGSMAAFLLPPIIVYSLISFVYDDLDFSENANIWLTSIFQVAIYMSMVSLIIVFIYNSGNKLRDLGLAIKNKWLFIKAILSSFAIYIAASVAIFAILGALLEDNELLRQEQELGFAKDVAGIDLLAIFLVLAIVVPVVEELVFRGFLFRGIRKRLDFWPAAAISAVIFALAHFQLNVGIDVFVMALALAWVYERTETLWAPIVFHMIKNSLAFILIFMVGS